MEEETQIMEMTVTELLTQLEAERIQVASQGLTADQLTKENLQAGLEHVSSQLAAGYLAQFRWQVEMPVGDPVNVRLETNLINVPLIEAPRLDPKLLDQTAPYEVKVYMVIEGDQVNASGLRIDELTTADELMPAVDNYVEPFKNWVTEHIATAINNRESADD